MPTCCTMLHGHFSNPMYCIVPLLFQGFVLCAIKPWPFILLLLQLSGPYQCSLLLHTSVPINWSTEPYSIQLLYFTPLFRLTRHSPSTRKASHSNPHPIFSNCMPNDVTLVLRCWTSFLKKHNYILLQTFSNFLLALRVFASF